MCRSSPLTISSPEARQPRSDNVPLHILITSVPLASDKPEVQWPDDLVSSANRWWCLRVPYRLALPGILFVSEGLKFPSLKDVFIDMSMVSSCPRVLLPSQASALRNLKLDHFCPIAPEFAAATILTTLALRFRGCTGRAVYPYPATISSLAHR